MRYETEKVEFKEIAGEGLYKEVVAFANTEGGVICIGINKEGKVIGLQDPDDAYTRITNGIRDAIAPDVTMFVKYTIDDNSTIRIEVAEGSFKPYYLKSKGLKPSGVYVRQGTSSAPASPEQIRRMIKNADGDLFEDLRSLKQELSFRSAAETFARRGLTFGEDKYYVLGIRSREQGLYSNLGLLLSDQCPHTVKVAVFSDEKNTVFQDRKEFSGSVFEQLEESFSYLKLCNRNRSVINGLARIDYPDYPEETIREALLNAIQHRDYSFSGSTIINVNDRAMEFISIGGLLFGISPEDIRNGISLLRNRKLTTVFHRLNFIESYGTGIRRIYALYEDCPTQPVIDVTPNSFRITLPNMNSVARTSVERMPSGSKITPQMQILLDYLSEHGDISDAEVQNLLHIKRTRAYTLMKRMAEAGLLKIEGRGGDKRYIGK
jgi:ATP-dependent DNA helicase RecG